MLANKKARIASEVRGSKWTVLLSDLLRLTFCFSTVEETALSSRVCKQWRAALDTSQKLWQVLFERDFGVHSAHGSRMKRYNNWKERCEHMSMVASNWCNNASEDEYHPVWDQMHPVRGVQLVDRTVNWIGQTRNPDEYTTLLFIEDWKEESSLPKKKQGVTVKGADKLFALSINLAKDTVAALKAMEALSSSCDCSSVAAVNYCYSYDTKDKPAFADHKNAAGDPAVFSLAVCDECMFSLR